MADFCLDCWNKLNGTNDTAHKYIISDKPSLCEECGQIKPVILEYKSAYWLYRFRFVIIFFATACRIILLPVIGAVYAVRKIRERLQTVKKK